MSEPSRPQPVHLADRSILRVEKKHSFAPPPSRDREGRPFRGQVSHQPPPRASLFADKGFHERIRHFEVTERVPGRHYWHREGGRDLCHYYDHSGQHWFGWTVGVTFHWTRWHAGYWWWYDRGHDRWCYWNGGHWWWPMPGRTKVVYVYLNERYVLPEEAPVETNVTVQAPPEVIEPAPETGRYFRNKAMDRMVGVFGERRDAFLYDASDRPAFRPIFLTDGAKEVRMSDDSTGKPLQILVEKEDGSYEIFDAQGRPYVPGAPPNPEG